MTRPLAGRAVAAFQEADLLLGALARFGGKERNAAYARFAGEYAGSFAGGGLP